MRDLSIYLHIPFCVKKCRYCDFLSYPADSQEMEDYLILLLSEIEKQSLFYKNHNVISVFIGGGTPSLLKTGAIDKILEKLKQNFIFSQKPEITLEMNPGTVTEEKLAEYRLSGINRLSIGLQSADDSELRTLGRIHNYQMFRETYDFARKQGFQNINIDLISAIPGQTADSYRMTLKKVLALSPEHISAYGLILEEGTWFYQHQNEIRFPSEEEDRQLYEMTGDMLLRAGYSRYEISNYAKEGFVCIHNQVYWKRGDYVGFGLGAASMVEEVRWSNKRTMREYAAAISENNITPVTQKFFSRPGDLAALRSRFGEDVQILSVAEQMEEFMFLGLRLTAGVKKSDFYTKFGISIEDIYGDVLKKLTGDGLLFVGDMIRLTPYGTDISNYVMAKFLLK